MASPPAYSSFLVRVWHRPSERSIEWMPADSEWLIQIELIPSGEHEYFDSLEALFAFLAAEVGGERHRSGDRCPGVQRRTYLQF